jgi:hypothetical protein
MRNKAATSAESPRVLQRPFQTFPDMILPRVVSRFMIGSSPGDLRWVERAGG